MALSLDDIEQEVEETKPSAAPKATAPSAPSKAVAPPPAGASFSEQVSYAKENAPKLINDTWKGVAPYLNPIHYQEGGAQDYTNIDWPTTLVHGAGEAALGYGLAKRGARVISGEAGSERAAQKAYQEQNKLAREKFEYQKKMDAQQAKAAAAPPLKAAPTPAAPPPPSPVQVAQQAGPVVARPADVAAVSNPNVSPQTMAIEERRIARQNQATQDLYRAAQPNFQSPKLTTPPAAVAGAPAPAAPIPGAQPPAPAAVAQAAAQTAPAVAPTVAQLAQEAAPAVNAAAQAPAEAVAPVTEEKSKTGRTKGAKNKTPEQRISEKGGLPGMTKEEAGMRGHLLGMYGGKDTPEAQKAYEKVREILGYTPAFPPGQGGSLTQEEKGKILDWRKGNIEGPKPNLTHEMKKTLKGGSAAAIAALALTPAFVNASESQKRQMIGEALLPFGMTPSELASGTLSEKQIKAYQEAGKLGSPYRSVPPPR